MTRAHQGRRLLVANFDCELYYARALCPGPHKDLPQRIRQAVSQAGITLGVFAAQGDTLWTMSPLAPASALRGVHALSGPLANLGHFDAVLAWGSTAEIPPTSARVLADMCWQDKLWHLRAPPEAAAACNDRRLLLEIEVDPEWRLELRVASSIEELDEYIATKTLGPDDSWVAKAPFAAAGRERVRRRGRSLQGEARVRCERLLQRYGQLVMEPWMPRVADYGITGVISHDASETKFWPPHRLRSDGSGVFRGIRIADRECEAELGPEYGRALTRTAAKVAETLFRRGYRGPFGIDSFVYTDRRGAARFQSLCEINARLCFGIVARAHAEARAADEFEFVV